MADATFWADPFAHIKREVFHDMLAIMAGFTGGIPPIDFDEGSSIPLALILQLADKLAPSHITDRFCKAVIFDHVLDGQTLHTYHLVFVNDACRKGVLVVATTVIDTGMHTCNLAPCLLPILGALLFLSVPTLRLCQTLFVLGIVARIAYGFASGEDHHRFEAQIKANLLVHNWKYFGEALNCPSISLDLSRFKTLS